MRVLGLRGSGWCQCRRWTVPGVEADLAAITQAEAVRLFAERADAVKPDFVVTEENAAAVAAVVRRLDGIALAIELAAARVAAMTPAELVRRLERSFASTCCWPARRSGTSPDTAGDDRLVFPAPRRARAALCCARLAVFAGGCTLEAAETVCGADGIDPDTVFELLASLVAKSLVVAEEHGPETRYRLLETIRQYGEERLGEAGETERWRARHADYYASLLPRLRHQSHDPQAAVFWAVRLSADQDNLLAAWSWAIDTGNVDTAFSMLAGFSPVEVRTGYPLLLPGEASLTLPGATEHPGYPLALAVSAVFASARSDGRGAEELCRRAIQANARHHSPDWRVEETVCVSPLKHSVLVPARSPTPPASPSGQRGPARTGGDLADASVLLTVAAGGYVLAGDAPRGVPLAKEALALARQVGAPTLIATALLAVGAAVAPTDAESGPRLHAREPRTQHGARISEGP